MISRDSVITQVSVDVKIAGHVKKKSISVNGNNIPEGIRCCSYCSYFKAIVIKHAKKKKKLMTSRRIPTQYHV
jgi:hypothetical protein